MASTVYATINANIIGTEELGADAAPFSTSTADRRLLVNALNESATLNSASTPALEAAPLVQEVTVTAGTTTIDLTAAPISGDRTLDLTGKKLVAWQIKAAADNSDDVTIAPGSSNPYPLFGASNERDLEPGELAMGAITGVASGKPAVSSTVKTIDITGTEDDVVSVILYFGT